MTEIDKQISVFKKSLIRKAFLRGGVYENFGEWEIRRLEDTFDYNKLKYGNENDRLDASKIDKFRDWTMNFDDNDLRSSVTKTRSTIVKSHKRRIG